MERISVSVSGENVAQFLGAPKAKSGTALDVSAAVMEVCEDSDWEVLDSIIGLCYDTTSVNTGHKNGAAIVLEGKMGKDLLQFPCRHHIFEVILSEAYYVCFGKSKEPDLTFFKDFKKSWGKFNKNNIYYPKLLNEKDATCLANFVRSMLNLDKQPRDDYLEFLHLVLIHCDCNFTNSYVFKKPGCLSNARWMNKAIYSLKMILFQNEYNVPEDKIYGLNIFCKFILKFYVRAWYKSRIASMAPLQDLNLIKLLYDNKKQSIKDLLLSVTIESVIKKYINHMWYLNEELICLSLFDVNYSDKDKSLLAKSILKPNKVSMGAKKPKVSFDQIPTVNLTDFVTENSVQFFNKLGVSYDFLANEPKYWHCNESFIKANNIIKNFIVVNDIAERGVSTVSSFCDVITHKETNKQNLFINVSETRKKIPMCVKKELL